MSGKDTYWHQIRERLPPHIQKCIPEPDKGFMDDKSDVEGSLEVTNSCMGNGIGDEKGKKLKEVQAYVWSM